MDVINLELALADLSQVRADCNRTDCPRIDHGLSADYALADAACSTCGLCADEFIWQIEKRIEKLSKGRAKEKDEVAAQEAEKAALSKLIAVLNDGKGARSVALTDDEKELIKGLQLLTMKPIIYAGNVAEGDLANQARAGAARSARRTLYA